MTEYRIVAADATSALVVGHNLRTSDAFEIAASGKENFSSAVLSSFEGSRDTWVGTADGLPVCIFGLWVPSLISTTGYPWFYGSNAMRGHELAFLRRCRPVVAAMASRYDELRNWVDARNKPAIQWLKWIGFEVSDEIVRFPRLPGKFHPYRYGSKS